VLSAERPAAVTAHAAVRVDDDLAAGEAAVALRTADDEPARRVDVELGRLVDQLLRKRLLDDELDDRLAELLVLDLLVVLRRHDDRVDADRDVVLVLERDLRLAVGAEEIDRLLLPDGGELLREEVRVVDRRRHELGRLVGRVPEDQALVARALLLVEAVALVDALRDVRALPFD